MNQFKESALPLLDTGALKVWKDIDPSGWKAIVTELIEIYIRDTKDIQNQLVLARDRQNYSQIAGLAHTLKSTSGNVGAIAAHNLCAQIEQIANSPSPTPSLDLLSEMLSVIPSTIAQLESYLQNIKAS